MAKRTWSVIQALREAARKLEIASNYQWGHMGSCNCGFLAQVVSQSSARQIHQAAMKGCGDWSEQLNDYCPASGFEMDALITRLVSFGFELEDLSHLERLSDPVVVASSCFSGKQRHHNCKADVVAYFRAWASLLEDQLIAEGPDIACLMSPLPGQVMTDAATAT